MPYIIKFTKQATKDLPKMSDKEKTKLKQVLVEVISQNPLLGKKLVGKLKGNFSYRFDIKNRIIYAVDQKTNTIYVKRVRTHYSN